jgi:hypothetical protein
MAFGIVQQRPVILVVKKNARILENLNNWVTEVLARRGDTEERPLLVIDDEADQASVDTGQQEFTDDETPDTDYEPKRINGQIRRMLTAFQRRAYVAYTATPFANILIHDAAEADGYGDDLFPGSFIVNLPTPSNYVGPSLIFGIGSSDTDSDAGMDVIRHVDQVGEGGLRRNIRRGLCLDSMDRIKYRPLFKPRYFHSFSPAPHERLVGKLTSTTLCWFTSPGLRMCMRRCLFRSMNGFPI